MTVQLPLNTYSQGQTTVTSQWLVLSSTYSIRWILCYFLLTVVDLDTVKEHLTCYMSSTMSPLCCPSGFPSLGMPRLWIIHTRMHSRTHTSFWFRPCWNVTSPRKWCPSSAHFLPKSEPPLPHVAQLRVFRFLHPVPHPAPWLHRISEPGFLPGLMWKEEGRCAHGWESSTEVRHCSNFASLYL